MKLTLALTLILAIPTASKAGELSVEDAWIRATPPGSSNAAAYMVIRNSGEMDRLNGASSIAAREVQIHTHRHADGMMNMEQIDGIDIYPDAEVTLKPHGEHLMMLGIKKPMLAGQRISMQLEFEAAGTLAVEFMVRDAR